jgi:septum formation protein
VLGGDSVVALDDGTRVDKPGEELAAQLRRMSGRTHRLHSAAVVCEDGQPVWRAVEVATMHVRPLSDAFIAQYVASDPEANAAVHSPHHLASICRFALGVLTADRCVN